MKRTFYFPEIFEMVGEAQTKEEKIAVLRKYRTEKGFLDILRLCYEPRIKWIVTREEIENLPFDHMDIADYDLAPTTLILEARKRLYNFTNVRRPPLKKNKVIRLIANMFSVLHHKEIELFKQMVDRNILETGLDEGIVREAFPKLLSGEYVPPEPEKRGPGRPKGSTKKKVDEKPASPPKKRGRPPGSKNKPKRGPGRPKGSTKKKTTTRKKTTTKTATTTNVIKDEAKAEVK